MIKARPEPFPLALFGAFALLMLASLLAGIALEEYILFAIPALALYGFLTVVDYPKIYWFLFALLPLSTEFEVTANLSTDLPTEPVMVTLFLVLIVLWVRNRDFVNSQFLRHPITIALMIHLGWILLTQIYTVDNVVSFKFFLAKSWYIGVFFFLTSVLIKGRETFTKAFWLMFIPLVLITLVVLVRHAAFGFSFDLVNKTVTPFFRNHVNYAAMLTVVFPFAWYARKWYPSGSHRRNFIHFGLLVLVAGIFFSYTRAAWVALIAAGLIYYVLKWRLIKVAIAGALIAMGGFIWYMSHDNKYLDYAPDFEQTIYHEQLGDHLEATLALQDVSSAERIYRWVAAFHMFREQPWTGYGPGNFYPYYKHHTVLSFQTYVSENPEKSTVHNYYLLMLVEQGVIGFLIFIGLVVVLLTYGERIYHRTVDPKNRQYVMALLLCVVIVLVHILVSDLIEVDKVGTLLFFSMALLVNQDLRNKALQKKH